MPEIEYEFSVDAAGARMVIRTHPTKNYAHWPFYDTYGYHISGYVQTDLHLKHMVNSYKRGY